MKRLREKNTAFVIFITAALALCVIITKYSLGDIQKNNYLERTISLNTVMSKIGEHLDTSFHKEWESARALTTRVERLNITSTEALTEVLHDIYMEIGADFKVVDENGIAYYHDGTQEYWKDHRSVPPEKETFLLSTLQFGVTNENYMKYITPLKQPLVIGDVRIIYSVLNEPLNVMHRDFNTNTFGDGCLSFVIDGNGAFIYENGSGDRMANSYNLLPYLEKNAEFQYGVTFAEFKAALQSGKTDTVLIKYAEKYYYMSFSTLAVGNWVAVMLVPEMNLLSGGTTLTQRLLFDISLVFVAAALVFVLGFLHMWRKTVIRQRLAAEAERRSNEAKTNFLSSMSHDIRTPMNAVVGMTEIALRCKEPVPVSVRENLEKIQLSSYHLLKLINDILDINKIESGKMSLNIAAFSVINTINTLSNMVCDLAKKKNIDLRIHTHDISQEQLLGDELRINQVYINLATNAIKYTPKGGRVDIDFMQEPLKDRPNELRLICVVKDTGIGMSKDFQKIMYDPFARATDSRVNTVAGSGLGLAICWQIVTMMEGTLECVSEIGKGTTFTASLIVRRGTSGAAHEPNRTVPRVQEHSNAPQCEPEEWSLAGMHVLTTEDNDLNWEIMRELLGIYGITASRAENGKICVDMLEAAEPGQYSAVLMDVRMPVMDGREATRVIRGSQKEWIRTLPVIAMTADAFAEDIRECLNAGMNAHLSKPIDMDKLLAVLRSIAEHT